MPHGRFDPAEALALIERYQISRWNAVPTMATRLLDHPDVHRRDFRSLRAMTLGGAPVHAELLQRIRSGLPSIQPRIATGYGLSENCGQATVASRRGYRRAARLKRSPAAVRRTQDRSAIGMVRRRNPYPISNADAGILWR